MYTVNVGVRESFEKEMEKYVLGGLSAGSGFAISKFLSDFVVKATGVAEAWKVLAVNLLTKVGLSLMFAGLSFVTGGTLSWVMFALSIGCVSSVFVDIIEFVKAKHETSGESYALESFGGEYNVNFVDVEPAESGSAESGERLVWR